MNLVLLLNKAPEYYHDRHGPPCPASTVLDSEPTSRLDAFSSEQVWPLWEEQSRSARKTLSAGRGSYTKFCRTIWVNSRGGDWNLNQSYQIANSQANDGWVCLCSGFLISNQVGLCMSVNGGDPKFEASLDIQWDPVYEKTKEEKKYPNLEFQVWFNRSNERDYYYTGPYHVSLAILNSQWSTSLWG